MDVPTLLWHLANVVAVPLLAGAIAATATWLVRRRRIAGLRWRRLATWSCGAACAAALAGFAVTGQDGRMATYAAIVVAVALSLWWTTAPS